MEPIHIVFDIGGTKTRVAAVDEGTALRDITIFETSPKPEEGLSELINKMRTIAGDYPVGALCGGAPGTVRDNELLSAHNLPLWGGVAISERLSDTFEAPTTLFNDAELVGLGEYYFGAGKGEKDMIYVTVSTGVGGVHIVDGEVDKGKYNAEIGHQIVKRAELEDLISGTAVEKKYGVHPKDLDDINILNGLADTLAQGLYDNVLHWSPEAIVLGGSMIVGKNGIPVDRVKLTLDKMLKQYYPETPRVYKAKLGDHGGLYGGMGYLARNM